MKIAFIVEFFPKLSETFILNQITGLIDRGCEIDIFAKGPEELQKIHPDVEKYKLLERTFYIDDIDKHIPQNKIVRILKGLYLIIRNISKKPRAIVKSLNFIKLGKHALSLKPLFRVIPYLDKGPYDIVHCHFGPIGKIGLYLRGIGALDGKLIITFHGYDLTSYVKNHGDMVYKELFAKADLMMPISIRWKDELIRLGCEEKKIVVHRMGIDTKKFNFMDRKISRNGKINVLSIGRLVEKKGFKYGIEAVAMVSKKYRNVNYTIIGGGELKDDLERLIKGLDLQDKIKIIGRRNQQEVKEILDGADIFLAPSVTSQNGDQEGIPVVLMEALSSGIPVVSTYHSGIPELIEDGRSGLLAAERDVDALSEKIFFLIENADKRSEFCRRARRRVEEKHDISMLNKRLMAAYVAVAQNQVR
jgi:colanic acid/amylovoran biosynthesis glycosyltransferase